MPSWPRSLAHVRRTNMHIDQVTQAPGDAFSPRHSEEPARAAKMGEFIWQPGPLSRKSQSALSFPADRAIMRPSASGSVPADARSNPLAPVPPPLPMILSPIIQLSEHKE